MGTSLKLLEGAAAALDGERDPRCLLAGFSAIQAFAELYAHSGEAAAKVVAAVTSWEHSYALLCKEAFQDACMHCALHTGIPAVGRPSKRMQGYPVFFLLTW